METILDIKTDATIIFEELQSQLNGSLTNTHGEYNLGIQTDGVEGTVRGMRVNTNKVFLEFDIKADKDVTISLASLSLNPLHFLYCHHNQLIQTYENSHEKHLIEEFQTAIVFDKNKRTQLFFKEGTHTKVTIISVCMHEGEKEISNLTRNIHHLFEKKLINNSFNYVGSYNLKIIDQISRINDIKEQGIVRKLLIEGTVQLILAMEIQHHQNDIDTMHDQVGSLTKRDLKIIQGLGQQIKDKPEVLYTIKDLTLQSGISAAKLQEGFKHLFGRTVTDFIKNVRIDVAVDLIKTTDLTISEIVYTIGFTSRSYFSKIFKERYNCSPRAYQVSQRFKAISA
ncbi:helix-turn-helix transcriptional regulator [Aquimarina sp. ERC-38]|uniref:helix-turn-helix transcriptional regulator n=1 Tax=Aquimarina sp. ERC-38 TaxID=2949996 RepID=UPI002245EED7|nr:helix-turn-helix transcriptional regulator [Aquimarina sp. ERC-38]UZO81128.1 helix-turn-helix transcriptional regulator [Aquimarina sp. ERC-38]